MMMNAKVGVSVGEVMGPVLEIDDTCGRFLRVRVILNLEAPLRKGTTITTSQGELTVRFKYEKLPSFCRVCGRLTHLDNDCPVGVVMLRTQGFIDKQFDDSLRAEIPDVKPHRHGNLQARTRMGFSLSGQGRGLPQPSQSSATGSRAFFPHVDSMVLRGRMMAAREGGRGGGVAAIGSNVVEKNQEVGEGIAEVSSVRRVGGIVHSAPMNAAQNGRTTKLMADSLHALRNNIGKSKWKKISC